ncbi:hypothetical protein [Actinophytocola xinjiangensis]|nr:hypothetical protein [Actinophytocola xinjiangensis]
MTLGVAQRVADGGLAGAGVIAERRARRVDRAADEEAVAQWMVR